MARVATNLFLLIHVACISILIVECQYWMNYDYSLTGFAKARGVQGGGIIEESDPRYRHVYNAEDLYDALSDPTTKVIEIVNDLNLGFYEIPEHIKGNIFEEDDPPKAHPKLMQTGVTNVFIRDRNSRTGNPGLTIFSNKGVTISHANFYIYQTEDLIIRNLKFNEVYEWDDESGGDFDVNEWDYITVFHSDGVWLDHLEFDGISYDGVLDLKAPSSNVTISWIRTRGARNGTDPFYVQQYDYLEANRHLYPKYDYLRNLGISKESIMRVMSQQKKGHLIGEEPLNPDNDYQSATIYNNVYEDLQDRLPRLRAGNVHVFNVINDFRVGQQNRIHRSTLPATPDYKFQVTSQASISTEGGAVLVENSRFYEVSTPVRNNQVDLNDPTFTGKIELNNMYYTYMGNTFIGSSNDLNSPLRPVPAEPIPFSWNGWTTLPYEYQSYLTPLDDLESILLGPYGSGVKDMGWDKSFWLRTTYNRVVPHCGSQLAKSSYIPERNFWVLCEINVINHIDKINIPCNELIRDVPYYGDAENILAMGGTFGCFVTRHPQEMAEGACLPGYNQGARLGNCLSCTHMGICIRVPVPDQDVKLLK